MIFAYLKVGVVVDKRLLEFLLEMLLLQKVLYLLLEQQLLLRLKSSLFAHPLDHYSHALLRGRHTQVLCLPIKMGKPSVLAQVLHDIHALDSVVQAHRILPF